MSFCGVPDLIDVFNLIVDGDSVTGGLGFTEGENGSSEDCEEPLDDDEIITDAYFEIVSRIKKENEMQVNLRSYPNPHLYRQRPFIILKKENLKGHLQYRVA